MRKFGMVCAALLLIVLLTAPAAWAKWDPRVETPGTDWSSLAQPWQVPSALTSYALFGRLDTYGDIDAFAYSFDAPVKGFPIDLSVPVCGQHFADFYPKAVMIGPGLDAPAAGALPFDLPPGDGAVIFTDSITHGTPRPISAEDFFGQGYLHVPHQIDIPQAGVYTLALFEPHNNVGAYMLVTGMGEPDFTGRQDQIGQTYTDLSNSDAWMGQDCSAPVTAATASCPATVDAGGPVADPPQTPVRWQVGAGFILDGDVMDGATCAPVANAQIQFWMANSGGAVDAAHSGTLFSNDSGMYRIETDLPGVSVGDPHIHLEITAPGFQPLETTYQLAGGIDAGSFPIVLTPQ